MNLLSRGWWHNLTFQQIQQTLIEKDFVLFKRALLLASTSLVEND